MKPVILWSDYLLLLLVLALGAFIISLLKNRQNRERWRKVFQTRLGLSSFLVILAYVSLALLDSIHFRLALPAAEGQQSDKVYYSNDVSSVLDLVLGEMDDNIERTYSAPFSLKSYSKMFMENERGETIRDFPALTHAGQHLENIEEHMSDILWQSLKAVILGLVISSLLIMIHKLMIKPSLDYPWSAAYWTITLIICALCWLLHVGNLYHVLGTDRAGNDVLYKCFKGIRTGMLIGTLATLIMMPIAIALGIASGYFKGWVDDIIQFLYTTLSSIPGILLISASVLLFQVWIDLNPDYFDTALQKADARFIGLCFILGVTSWATLCRLLRAETLKISQLEYVQAAHVFGVSHFRIIRRHILPNVLHIILITFILDFSSLVLAEAVLSYIGVGVDSAMHSWGNMISAGSSELSRSPTVWWNLAGTFIFMFGLVLAANLFSDLVNDAFDPRSRLGGSQS